MSEPERPEGPPGPQTESSYDAEGLAAIAADEARALHRELEPYKRPAVLPSANEFSFIFEMAGALAGSQLVPKAVRGKPADVAIVLLAARDMGVPLTQAFAKLNVIEGKLALSAEMMVALVLRDGHLLWCESLTGQSATACGQRKGSEFIARFTFTLADAATAGLCAIDGAGKPRARSPEGKPKPWEMYPKAMLWARAVSGLVRMNFPDVTAGVSYTPEELSDDERFAAHPASEIAPEVREELSGRIGALDDDQRARLKMAWTTWGLNPLSRLTEEELVSARDLIAKAEAIDVEEASEPAPAAPPAAPSDPVAPEAGEPPAAQETAEGGRSEDGDAEAPIDRTAGPSVFNGDTGHCSDCGGPIWYAADPADGGPGWLHAEDADAELCPASEAITPAGPDVDIDALYATYAARPALDVETAVRAEVDALTQTQLVKAALDEGVAATGNPARLKEALVERRLAVLASAQAG